PNDSARFGQFLVSGRLGAGGMGEVYRAEWRGVEPPVVVALKLIRAKLANENRARAMFTHEAQVAARLCHRNIVRVIDFGEVDNVLYLAMELVDGVALDRVIGNSLSRVLASYVVLELLGALEYAHELV